MGEGRPATGGEVRGDQPQEGRGGEASYRRGDE